MEQKNYRDDFEQFLRDCTDDFIMIPARKVWYGIYNDIHPAKRWPSLAIALVMIFTILFVGVSNNIAINKSALNNEVVFATNLPADNIITENKNQIIKNNQSKNLYNYKQSFTDENNLIATNKNTTLKNIQKNIVDNNKNFISLSDENNIAKNISSNNYNNKFVNKTEQTITNLVINETKTVLTTNDDVSVNNSNNENTNTILKSNLPNKEGKNIIVLNKNETKNVKNTFIEKDIKEIKLVASVNEEKAWKEDYALKNKPKLYFPKPAKTITYYLTPSCGFRTIAKNTNVKSNTTATNTSLLASSAFVGDKEIQNDNAALSLELGAVLKYAITKNIFFKMGAQVNYTNYVSNATSIGHSTQAKIATTSGEEMIGLSSYTTQKGKDALNNTTVQIAIPVGFDVKITSGKSINWYLGATIQPSYTFGGSAFLYSADEKNYITDFSMVRKLNINTAIETFITYKPASDIMVLFGPQIRYQLFSTYKSEYNYKENLYNLGFKIGVTRSF